MMARNLLAPRTAARAAGFIAVAATLVLLGAPFAAAQQPAPAPKAPAPAAKQPAAKQPAKAPAPAAPAEAAAPPPEQQMPVVYTPWTKFCGKDQNNPQAQEVCLTVKEARLETGQFLAGAALIEQTGQEKKLFRITLPLGMQLPQGTRMILDKEQPMTGRYVVCLPNGCMADFDVAADFVGKLKKGQQITLQGINLPGQAASYVLPVGPEFVKANEGPATDPKVFEEQQKKMQDELQKKAEEARKRLQATPAPGAPKQ